jgi:hypothetical protein
MKKQQPGAAIAIGRNPDKAPEQPHASSAGSDVQQF